MILYADPKQKWSFLINMENKLIYTVILFLDKIKIGGININILPYGTTLGNSNPESEYKNIMEE